MSYLAYMGNREKINSDFLRFFEKSLSKSQIPYDYCLLLQNTATVATTKIVGKMYFMLIYIIKYAKRNCLKFSVLYLFSLYKTHSIENKYCWEFPYALSMALYWTIIWIRFIVVKVYKTFFVLLIVQIYIQISMIESINLAKISSSCNYYWYEIIKIFCKNHIKYIF